MNWQIKCDQDAGVGIAEGRKSGIAHGWSVLLQQYKFSPNEDFDEEGHSGIIVFKLSDDHHMYDDHHTRDNHHHHHVCMTHASKPRFHRQQLSKEEAQHTGKEAHTAHTAQHTTHTFQGGTAHCRPGNPRPRAWIQANKLFLLIIANGQRW